MVRNRFTRALDKAHVILTKRFRGQLYFIEGVLPSGEPFLQGSSQGFTEGLSFMSAFYVIVTGQVSDGGSDVFQFSLMTFHGKKLCDIRVPMEPDSLMDAKLSFVEDLATNNIHICQGIQDLKERRWRQYLAKSKLPVLDKVKSTFFIEHLDEDVVVRARTCKYFVKDPIRNDHPDATDYVRCEYCAIYQTGRKTTLFLHRKNQASLLDQSLGVKLEDAVDDEPGDPDENEFLHLSEESQAMEEDKQIEFNEFVSSLKSKSASTFQDFKPEILPEEIKDEESGVLKKVERKSKAVAQEWIKEAASPILPDEGNHYMSHEDLVMSPDEDETKTSEERKQGSKRPAAAGTGEAKPKKKRSRNLEDNDYEQSVPEESLPDDDDEDYRKKSVYAWSYQEPIDYMHIYREAVNGQLEKLRLYGIGQYKLNNGQKYLFQCTVCLKPALERRTVINCIARHKESNDLSERVQCPKCQELIERGLLCPHFEEKHSGEVSCFVCQSVIKQEPKVTLTMKPADGHKHNFLRKHIIAQHHTASASQGHICAECGAVLVSVRSLEVHTIRFHKPELRLMCQHCSNNTFTTNTALKRHILSRHSENFVKCMYCEKKFVHGDWTRWFKHFAIHTKLRPWKCAHCQYNSYKRPNISIHLGKQHGITKHEKKDILVDEELKRQHYEKCHADLEILRAAGTKVE